MVLLMLRFEWLAGVIRRTTVVILYCGLVGWFCLVLFEGEVEVAVAARNTAGGRQNRFSKPGCESLREDRRKNVSESLSHVIRVEGTVRTYFCSNPAVENEKIFTLPTDGRHHETKHDGRCQATAEITSNNSDRRRTFDSKSSLLRTPLKDPRVVSARHLFSAAKK